MADRLLLVGWDAADWKILHPMIDAGEMPVLRRVVETGTSGALLCVQPQVPAAQWTSIATGKRPWQHRVCHPIAGRPSSLTLWEILARSGKRSMVVGWPATHGSRLTNTVLLSERYANPTAPPNIKPWPPAVPGTYWPEDIGARFDPLRMSPQDVHADVISSYVSDWKKIDQKRDRRLGQLRLFLAADFSHHAAMMALLSSSQWDFAAVRFPALGAISQVFSAYRPPRPQWIPEAEFDLYKNVIRNACRKLDHILGLLIQAAGTTAAVMVVSPHGVSPRPIPPSSAANNEAWKSPHGIFAVCGAAFASDALVIGATSLDVAPTILTFFGLPIGEDMEGRVLVEAFAKPPAVTRVASWESARPAILEEATTDNTRRESDWNLARSYLDAARYEQALPVLERLFRAFPERTELTHSLFHCQLTLQKYAEAAETLEVLLEAVPPGIWSILPQAELCVARKQTREARSLATQAWNLRPAHPEALRRLGMLLLRLREWDALADLAGLALKLDENEPLAWVGLAEAQLRKRLPAQAEEAAMRAIGLNYYMPQAHFILARAFIAQGKWDRARDTMQVLLQLQPGNQAAATYAKRIRQPPPPL
ncbi:MAG TPA: tetratricopeptide repeat protein [Verrucomicrobiae bacterium]|jgi:tetratricopeptide (TPR) repeat protein